MTRLATFLVLIPVAAISPAVCAFPQSSGDIQAKDLRCEYRRDPLGIDVTQPRLSWKLHSQERGQKQTAYQILVATDRELLADNRADLWDTGKIDSNQSIQIPYAGEPPQSRTRCYWKVRVWDKDGKPSAFSDVAVWEMGLLEANDWQAQWINDGKANPKKDEDFYQDDPAPLFRKPFALPGTIKTARLYITGLGYYEAYLNGQRIGETVLDPAWTVYSKRVFYSTYDVTDLLRGGSNCLGVTLGNGWYNPLPLRMWGQRNIRKHLAVGRPRCIAQLEIELTDGTRKTIVTDESWKVTAGPLRRNSIYLGEVYDARAEVPNWNQPACDDSDWAHAAIAPEPLGALQAQPLPPIKATAVLKPVKITEPQEGVYIFDMGQNFSGWVRLALDAPRGTSITLRFGELLHANGTLNPMTSVCGQIKGTRKDAQGRKVSVGGPGAPPIAWQADTYIAKGGGPETYTPRFTFHAFRYVEVTGLPTTPSREMMTGVRLNTDVAEVGTFACSNERLNRIQTMCRWTFLSNIFAVQSDCPHRERFGYGGDLVTTCDTFMLNYDMASFYTKAVLDWHDSALPDGMLTDTAPFVGIQYCGVGWAMAHPLLLQQLHQYYGDQRLIEAQYPTAKRWFDLVAKQNPDHIIKKGLSDHEALAAAPAPEMVTPLYCESARLLARLAHLLGRERESQAYSDRAEAIRQAYAKRFLKGDGGRVPPGTQASQSFALQLQMIDKGDIGKHTGALQYLIDDIVKRNKGRLTTGIFGTRYMLEVLSRHNHAALAYDLVNHDEFPGWGYMLANGATTLWEHWALSENTFSHNHPMFGSVSQWFFNWLGGIQPDPKAVGFDRVVIRPQIVSDLKWVRCQYDSMRGPIVSNWRRDNDTLHLDVTIPANVTARVYLPTTNAAGITESGKPLSQAPGVRQIGREGNTVVVEIQSGRYTFVAQDIVVAPPAIAR